MNTDRQIGELWRPGQQLYSVVLSPMAGLGRVEPGSPPELERQLSRIGVSQAEPERGAGTLGLVPGAVLVDRGLLLIGVKGGQYSGLLSAFSGIILRSQ